ncbi:MAG: ElyC/SanA/YdcF family protein [Candidatus Omnitrophota bacterium]|nr:ElyC/SanA/YdcF family protein [Candidatus Omnitrophota bacterium]
MLSGYDILCISSIDWDFIWQGHQEIMAALAGQGNRVLFVENTGVRAPTLRDLPRLKRRLLNWWRGTKGFRQVRERLFVYSPLILPFPYSLVARWINRHLMFRAIQRWMHAIGFRPSVVWTFLPTPLACDLLEELDPELTVYYCIDDLASSSAGARRISRSESWLLRRAELVFVTSERLFVRASRFNRHVYSFPFGVNFNQFEHARRAAVEPNDLKDVRGPVVGYIGGIRKELDQGLLQAVAARLPQVTFVMVGPMQTEVSHLTASNIVFLGPRTHEELPHYIKRFQAGLIPYAINEYTAHIYPAKLNEYLAMGIPVVATDLPEIRRFNMEHGEVVHVAHDAEEFGRAVLRALEPSPLEEITRRIEIAKQNSWDARIAKMAELIEERLRARQADATQWEVALRRLYLSARRRALQVALGLTFGYLLIFHSPVPWWLAEPLRVAEPPRPADAIVVFAGGVGESGKAGGGYQERVKQAVDLYQQGKSPRMIFSSGYTFVFKETEVMKELAMTHGVPATAIILETNAATTRENVMFVAHILHHERWRSILLVSSPYHMRRALLMWRKLAPDITVIPTPVPASQFYVHDRGASVEQLRGILHEYAAILSSWWKGWI